MMQTILKAIANGNLRMGTETTTHTPKFRRAMKKVCELEESLYTTLNNPEKELLEKLEDALGDVDESNSQQSFINGFRLGALVMVEVFAGCDSLILQNGN